MIQIKRDAWIAKDNITLVYVASGKLFVRILSTKHHNPDFAVQDIYLNDFCSSMGLNFAEIFSLLEEN